MIKDVEIRQATRQDVINFLGREIPTSIQAWIASYKGVDACLAGIMKYETSIIAFSDVKENTAPKITVYKTAKALNELIKGLGLPMVAGCKNKSKFLEKLGYTHVMPQGEVEVYKWNPRYY